MSLTSIIVWNSLNFKNSIRHSSKWANNTGRFLVYDRVPNTASGPTEVFIVEQLLSRWLDTEGPDMRKITLNDRQVKETALLIITKPTVREFKTYATTCRGSWWRWDSIIFVNWWQVCLHNGGFFWPERSFVRVARVPRCQEGDWGHLDQNLWRCQNHNYNHWLSSKRRQEVWLRPHWRCPIYCRATATIDYQA